MTSKLDAGDNEAPSAELDSVGALRVEDLSTGYGRITVVQHAAFEARPGEVLGIAGSNGAGKTTLLNALAGLNARCSGRIEIDGERIDKLAPHRRVGRGLALVPEGRQIIGSISVGANLDVTLMARKRLRADETHRARRRAVLELFPRLAERLSVPGGVLSGGEQQMLAIARALMTEPKVLLLDEPSQGLSPALVETVVTALERLKGTVTMVLVEQHPYVLEALADRVLILKLGYLNE